VPPCGRFKPEKCFSFEKLVALKFRCCSKQKPTGSNWGRIAAISQQKSCPCKVGCASLTNCLAYFLYSRRDYDRSKGGFVEWEFMTTHHWGENPMGVWQLEIRDRPPHRTRYRYLVVEMNQNWKRRLHSLLETISFAVETAGREAFCESGSWFSTGQRHILNLTLILATAKVGLFRNMVNISSNVLHGVWPWEIKSCTRTLFLKE